MTQSVLITWISICALVMLSLSSRFCVAQLCTETDGNAQLPLVTPKSFHASFATFFSRPDEDFGHATISLDANSSAVAVTIVDAFSGGKEFKVVFNQATKQILVIDLSADPYNIENCQVQNASSPDVFTSVVAKVSIGGTERIIPTGNLFNGAGLKIIAEGSDTVNRIITDRYRACFKPSILQGQLLEVTWWFSTASKKPVQVKIRNEKPGEPTVILDTVYVANPLRALPEKQDASKLTFAAPRGVYCKGLVSAKQVPNTFGRFSVGFDRFQYNLPQVPPGTQQLPDSFRESYDRRGNLSMFEGDSAAMLPGQNKYGGGTLARISDFTRGISYVKNVRFGNCTYEKLSYVDWAANPNPDGSIRIKNPDEFFFPSQIEMQYKGSGVYRSQVVDVYVGYKDNYLDGADGKKYPFSMEYYMDIRLSFDGTGQPIYKSAPVAIYSASTTKFNSLLEIFDFNTGVPRVYDHDISDCFAANGKQHFELVLSLDGLEPTFVKYMDEYRSEIMYSLVSSLSSLLNVSPLRIISPVVSVFMDPLVLVEITISERAEVPGYTPALPESQLSDVVRAMKDMVSKGTLIVDVIEGDLMFQVPIKDFASLDNRGNCNSNTGGMSSGAVAGLSIGMIILGILIGLAAVFAVMHFRKDSPFGFKPFGGESGQT